MSNNQHYNQLEHMFRSAPINHSLIKGAQLKVSHHQAELTLPMQESFFHAAGSLHGAIYFKLLDDSAYFAAASAEEELFLYTKSYEIHFRRPVDGGTLIATGELVEQGENEWIAISEIKNEAGNVVAYGEGIFVKSRLKLSEQAGYSA